MCKYSLVSHKARDAQQGESFLIGTAGWGSGANRQDYPVFRSQVDDCLACVQDETTMTLLGVPLELQQKHGIGSRAVVTMVDKGNSSQDFIRLEDGTEVPLMDFAGGGVTAYVGKLESPKDSGAAQKREPEFA